MTANHFPIRPSEEHVPAVVAIGLTMFLVAFEFVAFGLPSSIDFAVPPGRLTALTLASRVMGMAAIAGVQALFFRGALTSTRRWQGVYLGLFACATFLEYGYIKLKGAPTTSEDLAVALLSVSYWPMMIVRGLDWRALVPIGAFGVALLSGRCGESGSRRLLKAIGAILAVHAAFVVSSYAWHDSRTGAIAIQPPRLVAVQALARSAVVSAVNRLVDSVRPSSRREVAYRATDPPTRNVVLVVDETVRADHLSINGYARATTPWLERLQREGKLANWGVASSATAYSGSSMLLLLTGLTVFPDRARAQFTLPTIFQYAKAAGYVTHLFDGQMNIRPFGLDERDFRFIDDWRRERSFGNDPDTDFRMARKAAEVLAGGVGHFLLIRKRGFHVPQTRAYPLEAVVWPAESDAFDNAVHYNLDGFFRELLGDDGSRPGTVVVYTGDHGEVLGAAQFRQTVWESFAVPLLIASDAPLSADTTYRAGHQNIFPTLLDLMGVPPHARAGPYARSLLTASAVVRDRRDVVEGDVFGVEPFRVLNFDELPRHEIAPR